jgi:hypothetical protein
MEGVFDGTQLYIGLFYGNQWHDISEDHRAGQPITIDRAKYNGSTPGSGTSTATASKAALRVDNVRGDYDQYNPLSPLYGKAGRKTQIIIGYDPVNEDFENTTYQVTWSTDGDAVWARDNTQSHTGSWSLKSGTISDNQASWLHVTPPEGANTFEFWYKISSEAGYDQFAVWTDDGLQFQASGEVDWTRVTIDVTGTTDIIIGYEKDNVGSAGSDAVWLDDLRFIDARFTGEITKVVPDRTQGFKPLLGEASRGDAWADITAYGLLNRINRTTDPTRSALYRATMLADVAPAAYWTLEDPDGSTVAASAVGGSPMTPVTTVRYTLPGGAPLPPGGAPKFARDNVVPGSDKLVSLTDGGTLRGTVPKIADGAYAVDFVFRSNPGAADGTTSTDILGWAETGTYKQFRVNLTQFTLSVVHADAAALAIGTTVGGATATFDVYDGTAHHVRYTVAQDGSNYLAQLYIDGTLADTADNAGSPMAGTVGRPLIPELNPIEDRGDYMPTAIGHVTVWPTATPPDTAAAAFGNPAETTAARLKRLGREEGWPVYLKKETDTTTPMGPQGIASRSKLIVEIETTEDGLIFDQRGGIGLVLRTRRSQLNQAVAIAFNGVDGTLDAITRSDSDADIANDVTVTNYDGSEARSQLETGLSSVAAPPDGAGRIPAAVSVNVDGNQVSLADFAAWWRNRKTVDKVYYPAITVDVWANPDLRAAAAAVEPGDRITLEGLDYDLVDMRVVGITEKIPWPRRYFTFVCEPYQQFDAGQLDAGRRLQARSTTLNGSLTTSATSLTLKITDPDEQWRPGVSTAHVFITGEEIALGTIGARAGSGPWTQAVTGCTRAVNGVSKIHAADEPVTVKDAIRLTL